MGRCWAADHTPFIKHAAARKNREQSTVAADDIIIAQQGRCTRSEGKKSRALDNCMHTSAWQRGQAIAFQVSRLAHHPSYGCIQSHIPSYNDKR